MLIGRLSQMTRPLSLWHCDPELCSIEKRFNWKDGPFHGPSYTMKVNGANFSTLLPPGVQLLPHFEVWSYRACQPLQMWPISHFCEIHSLSYEASIFFAMLSQWGNFGTLLPPRGATFTPFWGWSYRACQPLQCGKFHFCESTLWATRRQSFRHVKSMRFFAPILPLGQTSYPRSLIKVIAHDSRLGRTFWHLIHGSVTKTVGGVARRNKSEEEEK